MVKDYLNQLNGYLNNDVNLFSGGLNTYMDKGFIEPDQMPYCINMTMYKPPMMCTRASRQVIFPNSHAGTKIVSMWAYNENFVIYITKSTTDGSQNIYARIYELGQYNDHNTNTFGYTLPTEPLYFCYCRTETQQWLYVANEFWKGKIFLNPGAAVPIGPLRRLDDDYYGIPAWHKGRLFLANPITGRVTFSALFDYDNFNSYPDMSTPVEIVGDINLVDGTPLSSPTGAYSTYNYVMTLNGQQILPNNTTYYFDSVKNEITYANGLIVYENDVWLRKSFDYSSYAGEFFVTNAKGGIQAITSFDDKLVIFCEHSIHLLYGDTPLTTNSSQFQLVDLNNNLGCASTETVSVGGGLLYWLGDDLEVYSYSGSNIDMISRPNANRYVNRRGGISNLPIYRADFTIGEADVDSVGVATSSKYYITLPIECTSPSFVKSQLFVYDVYNKVWWAEDGDFSSLANYSVKKDGIIMADEYNEVVKTTNEYSGLDHLRDEETGVLYDQLIPYKFHTRVYAADGTDTRKSISRVWFQASADANVYLSDSWTSSDNWAGPWNTQSLLKIGTLTQKGQKQMTENYLKTYDETDYEQQPCYIQKMYGQRLNTFQLIVEGEGPSKFYLMKRDWDAR